MKRIFLTLAISAAVFLIATIVLGLNIGDAKELNPATQSRISTHMLVGLAALTFATLVHAITLTYFMGTGRWLEETSKAYSLDAAYYDRSQKIKYGTLPGLTVCVLLLITTGAAGGCGRSRDADVARRNHGTDQCSDSFLQRRHHGRCQSDYQRDSVPGHFRQLANRGRRSRGSSPHSH
ncbi:MAG: hypothetical protein R3C49_14670 [Planctomycetaceae bacterium]